MAIYRPVNNRALDHIRDYNPHNNQVVMSGIDESYPVAKGIFFLEYVEVEPSTTITIKDGKGNTIASGMSNFNQEHSPLRCDYGISITGDVKIAKGYFVDGVFLE